jgi:glycosyltransferase involved in cell wall biosynthesis
VKKHPTILFVTDKFPWPLDDGGQIRTYQILKTLSEHSRVILVSTCPTNPTFEDPIRALGVEIVTVVSRRPPYFVYWFLFKAVFTRRPHPLPKNFSRRILDEIKRRIESENIRALHFNHLDAAQYIDWLDLKGSGVTAVFDTHNVLSKMYSRLVGSTENALRKGYSWIQWKKMCRYEHALMQKMDCVVVCSEAEEEILRDYGVDSGLVVPNGVDTKFFTPARREVRLDQEPLNLIFTGAMDYLPNADGIRWFCRYVLPKLDDLPLCYKFTVVGKNPPADLLAIQNPGKIEFTGRVDDVRPYTKCADIFVVPLQVGGGTRLKVLESLAMQIPVVSTRLGAEGLHLDDGVHLRLADDPNSIAQAIAELASQPDRGREIARLGRQKVLETYDWESVTAPLCEYYGRVLAES